jgi:hypothetical protein
MTRAATIAKRKVKPKRAKVKRKASRGYYYCCGEPTNPCFQGRECSACKAVYVNTAWT